MVDVCEAPSLMPFDAARERLLEFAEATQRTRKVPLNAALGKVLGEDQSSQVDVPPADNSAMDGYVVNTEDLQGLELSAEGVYRLPISQRIPAGADPVELELATAARIFTGAHIPARANAVIKQEDCRAEDSDSPNWVEIPAEVAVGNNIRQRGQDITSGSVIMPAGTRLQPHHLGVLASVGIAEVEIYQPLKVAVLSTGDELVEPGQALGPGQIYNSNRYTLTGLVQGLGMELVDIGIVEDTPAATDAALTRAAAEADVVISSGGVSVGEEDHVKASVTKLGHLNLWRLAMKPGKPVAYGHVQGKPFLGLPGNPAAVLVSFNMLARPYLLKMQGATELQPLTLRAPINVSRKAQVRLEFLRARLLNENGQLRIEPFPNQSSGVLSSAVWANGYAVMPANQVINEGDEVDFIPFSEVMA